MKRNYLLPLLFACLSVTKLYAQANNPQDNLSSSFANSPNASGGTYSANIGVNPFTGSAQISFSLFSYLNKSTGLSQAISLSYHGGGIRTDEMASNVGLGWNLNYAPVISREVRGLPDESDAGYEFLPSEIINSQDTGRLHRIASSQEDGEMDQYTYSTTTGSGSFVIGKGGIIKKIPETNDRIERVYQNSNIYFKITTSDGTKYFYNAVSISRLQYGDSTQEGNVIFAPTTWHVSKIISAFDKDTIAFDYSPHNLKFDGGFSYLNYQETSPVAAVTSYTSQTAFSQRIADQRLDLIHYPNGTTVHFIYDSFLRLDMRTDNALSSVKIENEFTNSSYSYKFSYSYIDSRTSVASVLPYQDFFGTNEWNYSPSLTLWNHNPENHFRLRLDSFYLQNATDKLPGYRFEYSSSHLPARGEGNTDHWGYLNFDYGSRIPEVGTHSGASKLPNLGSLADILSAITLPTGGRKEFNYELNDAQGGWPYTINGVSVYKGASYGQNTATSLYFDDDTMASSFQQIPIPTLNPSATVIYRIIIQPGEWPSNFSGNQNMKVVFFKKKPSHNIPITTFYGETKYFSNSMFVSNISDTVEFTANSGDIVTYKIVASNIPTFPGPNYNAFTIQLTGYHAVSTSTTAITIPPNITVGGARVKRVITMDGINPINAGVQEYRYVTELGNSSGIKGADPIYGFDYSESYTPVSAGSNHPAVPQAYPSNYYNYDLVTGHAINNSVQGQLYKFFVRSSAAQNAIQYFNGSPVGYTRVEEYSGTLTNNKGKIVYEFSLYPLGSSTALPFVPTADVDYKNGLPFRTSVYNGAGVLLKKSENSFAVYERDLSDPAFTSIKVAVNAHPIDAGTLTYENYHPKTAKVLPVKSVQTEYFSGNDSVVTTTESEYDTSKMVVRQVKGRDARDRRIRTQYYYPDDFTPYGAIADLQTKGIVYFPVRSEVWQDTTNPRLMNAAFSTFQQVSGMVKQDASYALTAGIPINFQTWSSSFTAGQLLPYNQPITKIAQMDQYDDKGNLLQSTSKGSTVSSIWDYNRSTPIAEVANASVTDIAYTSFEADGLGGWNAVGSTSSISTAQQFTGRQCGVLNNMFGLSKSNLDPAKTYILSCWCRQGAPSATRYANGLGGNNVSSTPVSFTASDTHNGWTLYKTTFNNAIGIAIGSPGGNSHFIDEVRLVPNGAAITTTTYDPLFGKTSICDASNRVTYFVYDSFGRLQYQKDMDGNIIKAYEYKTAEAQ